MTIITELANGNTEMYDSGRFVISPVKDFHPMLVNVRVFSDGKFLLKKGRLFKWWYKHVTFKSEKVQKRMQEIDERARREQEGSQPCDCPPEQA